jgi:hypothetical protein
VDLAQLFIKEQKRIIVWDAMINTSELPEIFDQEFCVDKPQVFLIMNNHERNIEKLTSLLVLNEKKVWIFDPWRLIRNPREILRYTPKGFTYLTLSHSVEILPNE